VQDEPSNALVVMLAGQQLYGWLAFASAILIHSGLALVQLRHKSYLEALQEVFKPPQKRSLPSGDEVDDKKVFALRQTFFLDLLRQHRPEGAKVIQVSCKNNNALQSSLSFYACFAK